MIVVMLECYQTIKRINMNLIYSGPIWSDGVEGLGSTSRADLLNTMDKPALHQYYREQIKNLFSIFIAPAILALLGGFAACRPCLASARLRPARPKSIPNSPKARAQNVTKQVLRRITRTRRAVAPGWG